MPSIPSATLYRRVPKTAKNPRGLGVLAADEKIFTRPTLLCCSGIQTNIGDSSDVPSANSFDRLGHSLLGAGENLTGKEPYDIVSVVYPFPETRLRAAAGVYHTALLKKEPTGDLKYDFARAFVRRHFLHLVQDAKGKRLPRAEVMKRMRNVQILGHSYGGMFIQQLGNALCQAMEKLDYTAAEIHDITSQVAVVIGGTAAPLAGGRATFTTLYLLNHDDDRLRERIPPPSNPQMLLTNLMQQHKLLDEESGIALRSLQLLPVTLQPDGKDTKLRLDAASPHHVLYASQLLTRDASGKVRKEKSIPTTMFRRKGLGNVGGKLEEVSDLSGHEVRTYFDLGVDRHGFMLPLAASTLLTNAMNNAIANAGNGSFEPLPAFEKLMESSKTDSPALTNENRAVVARECRYNERIREAALTDPPARGREL